MVNVNEASKSLEIVCNLLQQQDNTEQLFKHVKDLDKYINVRKTTAQWNRLWWINFLTNDSSLFPNFTCNQSILTLSKCTPSINARFPPFIRPIWDLIYSHWSILQLPHLCHLILIQTDAILRIIDSTVCLAQVFKP